MKRYRIVKPRAFVIRCVCATCLRVGQAYWDGRGFRASKRSALEFATIGQARRAMPRARRFAKCAEGAAYQPRVFRRGRPTTRKAGS